MNKKLIFCNGILRFWAMVLWAVLASLLVTEVWCQVVPFGTLIPLSGDIVLVILYGVGLLIFGSRIFICCGYHPDRKEPYLYGLEHFPADLFTVPVVLLNLNAIDEFCAYYPAVPVEDYYYYIGKYVITFLEITGFALLDEVWLHLLFSQVRCRELLNHLMIVRMFRWSRQTVSMLPDIGKFVLGWSGVLFLAMWGGYHIIALWDIILFLPLILAVWGFGVWLGVRYLLQLKDLQIRIDRLASGDFLVTEEDEQKKKKMDTSFAKSYGQLEQIDEIMNQAVAEKLKHEKFQTELITNVSHDIKTPLTSIVTYVDLLSREEEKVDPDKERVAECMEVLNRQSVRLKKLIEDLIEASRANTGQLQCDFSDINLGIFMEQVGGEYEGQMEAAGLKLNLSVPEDQIIISADGRYLARVLDNLLVNAAKYSAPGTRVYMELRTEPWMGTDGKNAAGQGCNQALIVIKNISRDELNVSAEELLQRFVRGESSRHSEGHGLGLSIVESLTKLQNGTFEIEIDGDMFKTYLRFPVVRTENSNSEMPPAAEITLVDNKGSEI